MTNTDFDPTKEMVSFEAHQMAHMAGFILEFTDDDRISFTRSEQTAEGFVLTVIDCGGAGAVGDPNDAMWTAFRHRYGPERTYTSTVHDQAPLATVLINIDLLPSPTGKDIGMDVYQSWESLRQTPGTEKPEETLQQRAGKFLNWLDRTEAELKDGPQKIAFDEGYKLHHTGGGMLALRKPHPDDPENAYYLITPAEGTVNNIQEEWVECEIGLYRDNGEGGENWVMVTDTRTLQETIDMAHLIELPAKGNIAEPEKTYDSWAEVSMLASWRLKM